MKTALFLTKQPNKIEKIFPWYISVSTVQLYSTRVMIGQFSVLHTKARLIQKFVLATKTSLETYLKGLVPTQRR